MSVWPDLKLNTGAPFGTAAFDWPLLRGDADATDVAADAPPAVGVPQGTVPDTAEPLDLTPPPLPSARVAGKRAPWSMAAMVLSAAVHAAALYVFAAHMAQNGVEADSDAISVEIVLKPDIEPAPTGVAGNAAETRSETAPSEPEMVEEHPAEAMSLDPEAPAPDPDEAADAPAAATTAALPVDVPDDAVATDLAEADIAAGRPEVPPTAAIVSEASTAENAATSQEQPPRNFETAPAAQPPILVAEPFVQALSEPPAFPPPAPAIELPAMENLAALASPPAIPLRSEPVDAGVRSAAKPVAQTLVRTAQVAMKPAKPVSDKTAMKDKETKARPAKPKADAAPADTNARPEPSRDRTPGTTASIAGNAAASGASAGAQAQYSRKIVGHVQRFKRYPQEAARNGTRGAVKVSITIDRAGRLSGARVAAGSGHAVLDKEAIATARRASPYPRPPEGLGGKALSISFTLRFDG
ncbi:MAG: TonB family protein [Mesorhizobium sp.]|nr:TonB family protein [Mesorhizobium sp.]